MEFGREKKEKKEREWADWWLAHFARLPIFLSWHIFFRVSFLARGKKRSFSLSPFSLLFSAFWGWLKEKLHCGWHVRTLPICLVCFALCAVHLNSLVMDCYFFCSSSTLTRCLLFRLIFDSAFSILIKSMKRNSIHSKYAIPSVYFFIFFCRLLPILIFRSSQNLWNMFGPISHFV